MSIRIFHVLDYFMYLFTTASFLPYINLHTMQKLIELAGREFMIGKQ
jgi:hypothetical protein